jgi:GMP synthase (glutamine-hydrolysing)
MNEHETITCTVIRHVAIEDLGYLGEGLSRNGIRFEYLDGDSLADDDLPEVETLIVLGGPMGAYETQRYPYLSAVIELIRRQLRDERPVLGICLGAQLVAAAAGARVYPGAKGKEIGWAEVELSGSGTGDPLWKGFPRRFTTFHWHGDTFDLPDGAERLAHTEKYIQSFRLGSHAYGVQFHPEVVPNQLESWIRAYRLELEREKLTSQDVLAVPDDESHRALAFRFGANIADWLRNALAR